jgi:hypothetical protein
MVLLHPTTPLLRQTRRLKMSTHQFDPPAQFAHLRQSVAQTRQTLYVKSKPAAISKARAR